MINPKIQEAEKEIEESKSHVRIYIELLKKSIVEYENDPEGKIAGGWIIPGLAGIAGHGKNLADEARKMQKAIQKRNNVVLSDVRKIKRKEEQFLDYAPVFYFFPGARSSC